MNDKHATRIDFTIMMYDGSKKRKTLIGRQKIQIPICDGCFKSWPIIEHFLICNDVTMCKACWAKQMDVK